jgi:3-oxoacyl-[acyl-carrier-protein] synthase-1
MSRCFLFSYETDIQKGMPITPLSINAYTLTSALGAGINASLSALKAGHSGLRPCDLDGVELDTWIGRIEALEKVELPGSLIDYDCRNNRLAYLALQQDDFQASVSELIDRHGADRIGVFIGTSTSGIARTEAAYLEQGPEPSRLQSDFDMDKTHNVFSSISFTRNLFGLKGPALAISTACSSSAKVFAAAHRYIQAGACDAALVGGVDSLCLTTLYGFNSLDLISDRPCRPWDAERRGINIGEAAGFALLESNRDNQSSPLLLGYGESSDAYHMSTPHPEGAGARLAMKDALERAGLRPDQVDYINLHGTATRSNDASEDRAVTALFGRQLPCSSTKGFTGHTLGAAGISEAIFSLLAIEHDFMPETLQSQILDPELHANVLLQSTSSPVRRVLTNSFGFGGNNCSLLLGAPA